MHAEIENLYQYTSNNGEMVLKAVVQENILIKRRVEFPGMIALGKESYSSVRFMDSTSRPLKKIRDSEYCCRWIRRGDIKI